MKGDSQLLRDYGLPLGLVAASGLLFWKTLLPQIKENKRLEQLYQEQLETKNSARRRLEQLEAMEKAGTDPLLIERLSRQYFKGLGLPANEVMVFEESE